MSAIRSPYDLHISELHGVQGVVSYKVVPCIGAHATLRAYNDQCLERMRQPDHHAPENSDWSAMYTQFTRDHVLGTVPYRWETTNEATLIAATFHSAHDILVIGGEFAYDDTITGAEKAGAVKARLGIDADSPLMPALGERNKLALVRETRVEWELVVPHSLLKSRIEYSEGVIALFRRHAYMPVTERWCSDPMNSDEDSTWEKWNEGVKPGGIPDLETSWFRK